MKKILNYFEEQGAMFTFGVLGCGVYAIITVVNIVGGLMWMI